MPEEIRCGPVGEAGLGWALACGRRGAAHERDGAICQDAHAAWAGSVAGRPCLVTAVADGHGDPRHDRSHLGAAFAVRIAVDELAALFASFGTESPKALIDSFKADFARLLLRRWREAVAADDDARRRPDDEPSGDPRTASRYGTTLLAALATPDRILVAHVGDGAAVLVRVDGRVERMAAGSEERALNETDSLGSAGAERRVRLDVCGRAEADLILLATDGLTESLRDAEELGRFARGLRERIGQYGWGAVALSLPGWLDGFSRGGAGDDITMAALILHPEGRAGGDDAGAQPRETSMMEADRDGAEGGAATEPGAERQFPDRQSQAG